MPPQCISNMLTQTHRPDIGQMIYDLQHGWNEGKQAMLRNFVKECTVCRTCNVRPALKVEAGKYPEPAAPEITIDFTDMKRENGKHCVGYGGFFFEVG